ncbi:hypothetical protein HU727_015310 [Pseudomonas sp. SWRI153]|uniref:Uncharacterized protein n=1 Tax=Pseudomonas khorasanensis TaxID=2745508 RepID=A0A923F5U0_9PSED|nr:hypothetical protein [Pseudomonas khorasanensis]MBV4486961.1 hypothetical protein [Pseudomonas khorasanensis]
MNTHKKLSESRIFQAALFTPLAIGSCLLTVIAYFNSNYSICFTSDCINNFFNLYKYPLSIMGLGIPLSAIAAAVHRSEETSLQIKASQNQLDETLKQNKFNNYIKHKEEFTEFLEKLEGVCDCKFTDPLYLYKSIFPKNSYRRVSFRAHGHHDLNLFPNKFLTDLKNNMWDFVAILYDDASDNKKLTEAILALHQITQSLKLSRNTTTKHDSETRNLIWPDNFSETSFKNLQRIIRSLASFSTFEEEQSEKRDNAMNLLRRQGSGHTRSRNLLAMDSLAAEIDDCL